MIITDNKKDLLKINYSNKEKLWDREYSPFTLLGYSFSIDVLRQDPIGKKMIDNYSQIVLIHENKKTTQYRDYSEDSKMTEMMSKILKNNIQFRRKLFRQYKYNCIRIETQFKKIVEFKKFDYNFIKNYNHSFGRMAAYVMPIQRCVDYMKDHPDEYGFIFNKLIELRKKYEYIFGGGYENHLDILCRKTAKTLGLKNHESLKHLSLDEFKTLFQTRKMPSNIIERQKLSVIIIGADETTLFFSTPAKIIAQNIHNAEAKRVQKASTNTILKGIAAYKKNAKGKVQVIRNFQDLPKFKSGNILVCPSTLPKYEPYYMKAKAIISDEGGLLCHAAIFCREFKVSGIIGTKIATRILKNGDLVEIDADMGIVKILSN